MAAEAATHDSYRQRNGRR